MAGMTAVTREVPYDSARVNNGILTKTFTGVGADATDIGATTAGTQWHIRGGYVTMSGAGTLTLYSAATVIGLIELASAGTVALPPVHSAAGEALRAANTDGATIFLHVEYVGLTASGQHIGY